MLQLHELPGLTGRNNMIRRCSAGPLPVGIESTEPGLVGPGGTVVDRVKQAKYAKTSLLYNHNHFRMDLLVFNIIF